MSKTNVPLRIKNVRGHCIVTAWRECLADHRIEEVTFSGRTSYDATLSTAGQCRKVAEYLNAIADEWDDQ